MSAHAIWHLLARKVDLRSCFKTGGGPWGFNLDTERGRGTKRQKGGQKEAWRHAARSFIPDRNDHVNPYQRKSYPEV